MTIFQLLLYSCVVSNGLDGELLSKACRWSADRFYSQETKCTEKGAEEIGRPIFSDVYEKRSAEKFKCAPVGVIQ